MPILNIDGEIELIITHKCNWDCPYCSEQTHNKENLPLESVIRKIHTIKLGSVVTLSGGEVGILTKNDFIVIMDLLIKKQCKLNLNTNGLFLYKYPEYIDKFDYILYHCSENLYGDIVRYEYDNVHYALVVTDENLDRLSDIINSYPDIMWNIIPSSRGDYDVPILSDINKRFILKEFGDRITIDTKKRLMFEKKWDEIKFI